jgi:acetylornithine deacetylase/succinyl-diaminopimelate desuccinylase-like protein
VKISCRLVPNQTPEKGVARLHAHLERHCPPGVVLTFADEGHGAPPYRVSADNRFVRAAADTLAEAFGMPPDLVGMGGSVPIVTTFKEILGADTVFFSFSVGDEDIHAPNEFYRPDRFRLGPAAWVRLWERIGRA